MINLSVHDPKFTHATRFASNGRDLVAVNFSNDGGQIFPIIFSDIELAEKIILVFEGHNAEAKAAGGQK